MLLVINLRYSIQFTDRLACISSLDLYQFSLSLTTKYFKGRVTLFFANNSLTEYRITMEFLHNFFRP